MTQVGISDGIAVSLDQPSGEGKHALLVAGVRKCPSFVMVFLVAVTTFAWLIGCDFLNKLIGLTPPIVAITSPISNSTVTAQNITISGTVRDGDGDADHVEAWVESHDAISGTDATIIDDRWSIVLDISGLSSGSYTVLAKGYDAQGNKSALAAISFILSNGSSLTVSYNSQGGSAVSSQIVDYGDTATTPTVPTKAGYTFAGWFKEAECINAWPFSSETVTSDLTLYAGWAGDSYVATPVFSLSGGTYYSAQSIMIVTTTPGATIRYTADATIPTSNHGIVYSGPVSINTTTTLKAIAYKSGRTDSAVASAIYTIQAQTAGTIEQLNATLQSLGVSLRLILIVDYGTAGEYRSMTVTSYALSETEVVQGDYQSVTGSNPSSYKMGDDYPVETVTWYEAVSFCNSLSFLCGLEPVYDENSWQPDFTKNGIYLPTEAQWVFAAGGPNHYTWSLSDTFVGTDYTWNLSHPSPVKSHPANGYGLYDMSGNVSEWLTDWYGGNYPYIGQTDPVGPTTGSALVNAGGGFHDDSDGIKSDIHGYAGAPTPGDYRLGFRVAFGGFGKWTVNPTYAVTYNGNTNAGGHVPVVGNNYEEGATVTVLGNTGSLVKTGNLFGGWNTSADGTGVDRAPGSTFTMGTANVTLYAQWTRNFYTVGFDSQGGTTVNNQIVDYGDTATTPAVPARDGYTFAGWFKESACINTWVFASETVTSDVTLYAKWTGNSRVDTPVFSPPGGSYTAAQNITITTTTPAATIHYTTDNTIPTSSHGMVYTDSVSIQTTTTLKAIAYKSGRTDSAVTIATYTISPVSAATPVSGTISSNTTWAVADSPFQVIGNVLVASGVTLTIEAGVTVKFDSGTYIKVEGDLVADGTSSDGIVFTSSSGSPAAGDWSGIRIRPTSGTTFDGSYNYVSGTIFDYVTVKYASTGLYVYDTGLLVTNSSFQSNSNAMEIRGTENVILTSNTFDNNSQGIYSVYSDHYGDSVSKIENTQINNNVFSNNGTAVALNMNQRIFETLDVVNNEFSSNSTAISIGGGGYGPKAHSISVTDNWIHDNGIGISFPQFYSQGSVDSNVPEYQVIVRNNKVVDNTSSPLSIGRDGGVKFLIEPKLSDSCPLGGAEC